LVELEGEKDHGSRDARSIDLSTDGGASGGSRWFNLIKSLESQFVQLSSDVINGTSGRGEKASYVMVFSLSGTDAFILGVRVAIGGTKRHSRLRKT